MGLEALGLSLILALAAATGSALAVTAWSRLREPRFLLLAAAQWALLATGVIWAYGEVASNPPAFAHAELPNLGLVALAAVLLVVGSIVPRRR